MAVDSFRRKHLFLLSSLGGLPLEHRRRGIRPDGGGCSIEPGMAFSILETQVTNTSLSNLNLKINGRVGHVAKLERIENVCKDLVEKSVR